MAGDLLKRLKQSPVLCDGAMGTLLYAKGVFINRCYDELNLSQPDLIRNIHHEYLHHILGANHSRRFHTHERRFRYYRESQEWIRLNLFKLLGRRRSEMRRVMPRPPAPSPQLVLF